MAATQPTGSPSSAPSGTSVGMPRIVRLTGATSSANSGGGGNRTRVRGRTGESVYKRSLRFRFARRPARRRPTDGLAILRSPAPGDWLSLGSEPVS